MEDDNPITLRWLFDTNIPHGCDIVRIADMRFEWFFNGDGSVKITNRHLRFCKEKDGGKESTMLTVGDVRKTCVDLGFELIEPSRD